MDTKEAIRIAQDVERLAVLKQLELLDTPMEATFNRFTHLVSRITNSPISLVSLVDANRQFFKSQVGLAEPLASERETPLSHSFCKHVVAGNTPLIVEDAREHPVLKDNLAVPDLGVIAYLGMPLTTTAGVGLGSFCVIDTVPRKWTEREIEIMYEVAFLVMTEIELRVQVKARIKAEQTLQQYVDKLETTVSERTQELKQVLEQLQKIDRLKSKFIDDISHELRTPVTNINLYLDLLKESTPKKRDKYVAIIQEQNGHLISLLDGILDFSNLQKSLEQINLVSINFNDLVANVVASFEETAKKRDLKLSFTSGADVSSVWGDKTQLEQLITQLVQNAIAYTPSGQIDVRTHYANEAEAICLTCEDSGMGMDEEELNHCFDRFFRGKRIGQLNLVRGSGLGLAKVKEIVALHKGSVEVESKIDQGSTFSVYLPVIFPPQVKGRDPQ